MIREISEHKRAEETLRSSEEQLREFAARLEAVREEERARVAREIHDELGQALTVLKLDLSWLNSKTKTRRTRSETRKKLNSMIVYVDDTIARVRQIASELRPSILDDLGLIPAIEWQLSEFQKRTGIRCQFRPNVTEADLGSEKSAAIFRVVQEALTNVMRHAKASTVRVSLNTEANALRIFVEDDGKGITEEEMKDMKSLGIVGMKERISRLGGEFKIQSGRGKGTRLDIILPGAQ
jgi:signal transduction histidine kinase